MPFDAPVIKTVLPRRCRSMGCSFRLREGWGGLTGKIVRRHVAQVNIAVQRCARVKFGSLQTRSTDARSGLCEESINEQRKKTIPDRGHSRRWHRQGSDAGGPSRRRGGGEKARRRRAFRSFRFRLLRLLRKARPDDAGRLEGKDRQA